MLFAIDTLTQQQQSRQCKQMSKIVHNNYVKAQASSSSPCSVRRGWWELWLWVDQQNTLGNAPINVHIQKLELPFTCTVFIQICTHLSHLCRTSRIKLHLESVASLCTWHGCANTWTANNIYVLPSTHRYHQHAPHVIHYTPAHVLVPGRRCKYGVVHAVGPVG